MVLVALSVLPVIVHSLGAPLGEPFADDFDYIARALLEHRGGFFDGYGSTLYWRPLGRQVYFGLLAPLILDHSWIVPVLHVILLALTAFLLDRSVRTRWPGSWSAFAASFPLFAESARMLIAWPSHFMDLGALLFAAVAVHEASRRRMATALLGVLGSLLCKEVGILTALLVPWIPGAGMSRRERWRWMAATAALVVAWGLVYWVVCSRPGMTLPHRLETDPHMLATPIWRRLSWVMWNCLRAMFSLSAHGDSWDGIVIAAVAAILAIAVARTVATPGARHRVRSLLPWMAWGMGWFVLSSVPLVEVYPAWSPYRAVFGGVGLGIALAAALGAADARLLAPLFAVRLVAFALSPGPPSAVSHQPKDTGAAFDFGRLVRLERLLADTRSVLRARFPVLPRGSRVCEHLLPLQAEYAFAGHKSLQVWYRDTTLRWVRFERFEKEPDPAIVTFVEYQPESRPQIALVEPDAIRRFESAAAAIHRSEIPLALRELDAADSIQRDRNANVFIAMIAAKRALCLTALGDDERGRTEAERALALSSITTEARFALSYVWLRRGNLPEVRRQIEALASELPGDPRVSKLAELCAAAERRGGP